MASQGYDWLERTGIMKEVSKGSDVAKRGKPVKVIKVSRPTPEWTSAKTTQGKKEGYSTAGDVGPMNGHTGDGWPSKPKGSGTEKPLVAREGWKPSADPAKHTGPGVPTGGRGGAKTEQKSAKIDPPKTAPRVTPEGAYKNFDKTHKGRYETLERKGLTSLKGPIDKALMRGHNSGGKVEKVMKEYKSGKLHSGSKSGPAVKSRKQAIAIGLSQARRAGEPVAKKK